MPLEIEIKLKLPNHDEVLQTLRAVNATHTGEVMETNIFFDRPDDALRKKDTGLRVRLTTPIDVGTAKPEAALLTVKGPAQSTGLRSREAYDLTCTPSDQLIPLLKMLGFDQNFLFEKRRDSWEYGGCKIELDTLPHFGTFLEIEGPSEEAVHDVQQKLGLAKVPQHKESYSKMVSAHLKSKASRELRF